jgi:SAM-dependent methyltransferase
MAATQRNAGSTVEPYAQDDNDASERGGPPANPDYRFSMAPKAGPVLDAPFVPTPAGRIQRLLQFAQLTTDDLLVDLGCGDGRVLHTAAAEVGCRCLGVDIDDEVLAQAIALADARNLSKLCTWKHKDARTVQLPGDVTILVVYMLPAFMGPLTSIIQAQLKAAQREGRKLRVVSMVFHFASVMKPVAIDSEWQLQMYDVSSIV